MLLHVIAEAFIPKTDERISPPLNFLSDAASSRVGCDHDDGVVGVGSIVGIVVQRTQSRRGVTFGDNVERGHGELCSTV